MFIINAPETTDWKDVETPRQQQRINPKTTKGIFMHEKTS
jgi:hypothetical protein